MSERVYIEGARVVKATAFQVRVEIGGVELWILRAILQEGTTVTAQGDVGWLALPAWFVREKKIKRFAV